MYACVQKMHVFKKGTTFTKEGGKMHGGFYSRVKKKTNSFFSFKPTNLSEFRPCSFYLTFPQKKMPSSIQQVS